MRTRISVLADVCWASRMLAVSSMDKSPMSTFWCSLRDAHECPVPSEKGQNWGDSNFSAPARVYRRLFHELLPRTKGWAWPCTSDMIGGFRCCRVGAASRLILTHPSSDFACARSSLCSIGKVRTELREHGLVAAAWHLEWASGAQGESCVS